MPATTGLQPLAISTPRTTTTAPTRTSWARRIVNPGTFTGLINTPAGLYAVRAAPGRHSHADRVVRLDDTTGRTVSQSAPLGTAGPPVWFDGSLWLSVLAGYHRYYPTGPEYLDRLDPATLQATGRVILDQHSNGTSATIDSDGRLLWLEQDCTLERLDANGRVLTKIRIPIRDEQCDLQVATVTGGSLYTTYQQGGTRLVLQRRNPDTGQILATAALPTAPDGVGSVAATRRYLWAAGGFDGTNGELYWYTARPLRLIGATGTDGGGGPTIGHALTKLPSFAEYPDVTLSGSTIWVAASGGSLACIDPATGRINAAADEYHQPIAGNPVVTPHAIFTIATNDNQPDDGGIATLDPPAACHLH